MDIQLYSVQSKWNKHAAAAAAAAAALISVGDINEDASCACIQPTKLNLNKTNTLVLL